MKTGNSPSPFEAPAQQPLRNGYRGSALWAAILQLVVAGLPWIASTYYAMTLSGRGFTDKTCFGSGVLNVLVVMVISKKWMYSFVYLLLASSVPLLIFVFFFPNLLVDEVYATGKPKLVVFFEQGCFRRLVVTVSILLPATMVLLFQKPK
jgi:hypothetical protein